MLYHVHVPLLRLYCVLVLCRIVSFNPRRICMSMNLALDFSNL